MRDGKLRQLAFETTGVQEATESLSQGAVLLRGFAKAQEASLLETVAHIAEAAPFRHMSVRGGFKMSVGMTNCGALGWVSDETGYRYDSADPLTGHAWPSLPLIFDQLATSAAAAAGFPEFRADACLVNRYLPGSKMGLHQDKNEVDMQAPIVSVSLGLPATFLFGGLRRNQTPRRLQLLSGDVVVWGGPARLTYHGVARLAAGDYALTGGSRINLTFRKAGTVPAAHSRSIAMVKDMAASTLATKRIAPPKRLLYGPGPAMVDPRVYEALSQPVVGLRDPYFLEVMHEIQAGLRQVFGTENEKVFLVPASGSGAMEAAIANFVAPASKFLLFTAGVFAERIATMAERQRAHVVRIERPWGEIFTSEEAQEAIDREQPDVVAFVQAETSTGAYQSGAAIAPHARRAGALVIADCIASLGAMPVEMDSVGIDVAFSCSQKGLSCPAGLSPITFSTRAEEKLAQRTEPPSTWYFDLQLMSKYFDPPHTYQHTPSPPLYYALHQGLAVIEEEGLRNRWERHKRAGEQLVRGLEKLGFTPFVQNARDRIWHLTTVTPPAGVDEAKLREALFAKHGIEIAAGLGKLAGKILRIGTMGPLASSDKVDALLTAIESSL